MCDCTVCQRLDEYEEHLKKIEDPEERKFWDELCEQYESLDFELDYYKAIVDGSWPNADKVIEAHRGRKAESLEN